MKKAFLGISLLLSLIAGCQTEKENIVAINIDLDKTSDLPLEKGRIIPLETNDSSLLYDIINLEVLNDNYFIRTRDRVLAFDQDGSYLFTVSSKGQGPKEYLGLQSFFVKDEELYLWDMNAYSLKVFNADGEYVRTQKIKRNKQSPKIFLLSPFGEDRYIAKNVWNGIPGGIPALAVWDQDFEQYTYISGRDLYDGSSSYDFVNYSQDGTATYWEFLNDTIYKITGTEIRAEYVADFGKYSIPQNIKKEGEEELYHFINKQENKNRYVTLVRYSHEEGNYIYFMVGMQHTSYFAIYDKSDFSTKLYELPKALREKYILLPFLKLDGDKFIFALLDGLDVENNQSLLVIDKKSFLQ